SFLSSVGKRESGNQNPRTKRVSLIISLKEEIRKPAAHSSMGSVRLCSQQPSPRHPALHQPRPALHRESQQ
ncbi:hypothetical protein Dimus_031869, partial [Dionaea muscipula]